MIQDKEFFSKFEFIIYCGCEIIRYSDAFSITLKGYSQDGLALLIYNMDYVYKDWYNRPVDSLYSYISDTYFSDFQNKRCYIAQGLMAGVLPFQV